MKISIDELRSIPGHKITLDFKESIEGLEAVKPLSGELTVQGSSTGMRVYGQVQALLKLTCDRCLRPYFLSLTVPIDEKFVEAPLHHDFEHVTREKELTAEDFVEQLDHDGILDISDVVYQAVTLATPGTTLCGGECPGPAFPEGKAVSGSLAGDNQAAPSGSRVDPRWKNLKTLFPNRETDEKS